MSRFVPTGLVNTFVKNSLYEDAKNCGFCFLEYDNHSDAMKAKRLLNRGNIWGRQLFVDWAQRRKQPDENDLKESKTLFVNYLPKEITDAMITEAFDSFGTIEKITKIKDYAFVLFTEHEAAKNAMDGVDKMKLGHENIEISLAMPRNMKVRHRYPSFNGYHQYRGNGRPRSYNRRRFSSYGSSGKFYMRHQHKPKTVKNVMNETVSTDAAVSAGNDVQQTIVPMPTPEPIMAPAETFAH